MTDDPTPPPDPNAPTTEGKLRLPAEREGESLPHVPASPPRRRPAQRAILGAAAFAVAAIVVVLLVRGCGEESAHRPVDGTVQTAGLAPAS